MWVQPKKRPKKMSGVTIEKQTGCGPLYITINEDEDGVPFEVFARLGKAGGCAAAQTEAIGRLVSLLLRCRVDPQQIIKHLKGIQCDRAYGVGFDRVTSCADAIGKALEEFCTEKKLFSEKEKQNLSN